MPRITLKETITKEIEIPLSTLYALVDGLSPEEKFDLLSHLSSPSQPLQAFKKDGIDSIMADFTATGSYEENFLRDLKKGLEKSSLYRQ